MALAAIPISTREKIINEWVFKVRDRSILKRRFLDGATYESLAEEFEMSYEQIKRISKRGELVLLRHADS